MREEEILGNAFDAGYDRCLFINTDNGYMTDPDKETYVQNNKKEIEELAMERAIGFAAFIKTEDYKPGAGNKHWYKWNGMDCNEIPFTDSQLYDLFLSQLKEKL